MPSLIAEWGYNMLDALERFRWDGKHNTSIVCVHGDRMAHGMSHEQLLTSICHVCLSLADCELFLKVLTGEVPEEAYYDQVRVCMYP